MRKYTFIFYVLGILAAGLLSGCVTTYTAPESVVRAAPPAYTFPVPLGVYHQVEGGQTLWTISKNYGTDIKTLMKCNNISSAKELTVRDRIFIPSSGRKLPIEPLYASSVMHWKYIIIHHSATDVGSAEAFTNGHLRRGFWQGMGYHFVIDNGTGGTTDGDIEVGRRWFYQREGAHCNAGGMNSKGIGICLVGNFDKELVSQKQLESLVALVDQLRRLYNIPLSNIMGHRDVQGATTDCPGNDFPWAKFRQALSHRSF